MKDDREFDIDDDPGFETWGGDKVDLHEVEDSDDLVDPDSYYMALGNYADSNEDVY